MRVREGELWQAVSRVQDETGWFNLDKRQVLVREALAPLPNLA